MVISKLEKIKLLVIFLPLLCGVVWLLFGAFPVSSAVNEQISFQGKLTNASEVSVADGNYDMIFNLYTVASGGTAIWTGTHTTANGNPVAVEDGIFTAMLGSGTGNSLSGINFNQTLYLGITVGADSEMAPRKVIGSVPQAIVSKYLETASGSGAAAGTGADNVLLLDGSGNIDISGDVIAGGLNIDSGTLYVDVGNDRVGIGTTSPGENLEVNASNPFLRIRTANSAEIAGLSYYNTGNVEWVTHTIGTPAQSYSYNIAVNPASHSSADLVSATVFRIENTGEVGIGTTSPSEYLEIYDDTNSVNIELDGPAAQNNGILFRNAGVLRWYLRNSSTQSFLITRYDASGVYQGNDLSISSAGQITVANNLYINGDTYLNAALRDINDSAGTSGQVLSSTGTGVDWIDSAVVPTGTEGQMLYNNAGAWTAFSGMYWDDVNSRLGIGTTSPDEALEMDGNIQLTGVGDQLIFADDGYIKSSADNTVELQAGGTLDIKIADRVPVKFQYTDTYFYSGAVFNEDGADYDFRVESDTNTHALFVQASDGYIGIGTSVPETLLNVNGDVQLGTTDGTRHVYFDNGTGSNSGIRYESSTNKMQFSHDGSTWSDMGSGGSANLDDGTSAGQMAFWSGSTWTYTETTELFWDDTNKYLGIGTSSPSARLHLYKTSESTAGQDLVVESGLSPNIRLSQNAGSGWSAQQWDISGNQTNFSITDVTNGQVNPFVIETGSDSNSLYIGSGGNVGIGTSSPLARLHISDGTNDLFTVSDTQINAYLPTSFNSSGDVEIGYDLYFSNSTASYITSASPLYIRAGDSYANVDLVLGSAGGGSVVSESNLIPTTDDIYSLGTTSQRWSDLYVGSSTIHIGSASGDEATLSYDTTNNDLLVQSVSDVVLQGSGGNVGIGTTNPLSVLHLADSSSNNLRAFVSGSSVFSGISSISSADPLLRIEADTGTDVSGVWYRAGGNDWFAGHMAETGSQFGVAFENNAPYLIVNSSGNVGVGTTDPSYSLDVSGTAQFTGGRIVTSGSASLLLRDTSGPTTGRLNVSTSGIFLASDTEGVDIDFYTTPTGGSLTHQMRISDGGSVGIGTTSPSELLNLYQDVAGQAGLRIENPHTIANGGVKLDLSRGSTARPAYIRYQTLTTDEWYVGELYNAGVANTAYSISTGYNLSDSKVTVLSSGNVGIGTVTPGAKLDVVGAISTNNQLISTVATGTAPLSVSSTTVVANLNADSLDGLSSGNFIRDSYAGDWEIASSINSSAYTSASLEVRELDLGGAQTGAVSEAPRISFHWAGRVASQIGMGSDGNIRTFDNPGTGYEDFAAADITANGNLFATGGYLDDDTTLGEVSDDWLHLNGYIEMRSNTDNYGIVLRDSDTSSYFGITQVGGASYLTDSNTYTSYFIRGDGADATVRGTLSAADITCTDCLNQGDIAASAVGQGELKTATGEVSRACTGGGYGNYTLPGGNFGFYPQVRNNNSGYQYDSRVAYNVQNTSYVTYLNLGCLDTAGFTIYAIQRYMQASPPYYLDGYYIEHFIYALWNKNTGDIEAMYVSEDPPWENNSGDMNVDPHPFIEFLGTDLPDYLEIALINPERIEEYKAEAVKKTNGSLIELFNDYYKVDTKSIPVPISPETGASVNLPAQTVWRNLRPMTTAERSVKQTIVNSEPSVTQPGDLAEYLPVKSEAFLSAGDIVSVVKAREVKIDDKDDSILIKSSEEYDSRVVGIISTNPSQIINVGGPDGQLPLALTGSVPVKVASINGSIGSGDSITTSVLRGYGMLATKVGTIVGRALESNDNWSESSCTTVSSLDKIVWPEDDGSNQNKPCFRVPVSSLDSTVKVNLLSEHGLSDSDYFYVGKIMAFVNVGWYESKLYVEKFDKLISDYEAGLLGSVMSIPNDLSISSLESEYGNFLQLSANTLDIGKGSFQIDVFGNVMSTGNVRADQLFSNSLEIYNILAQADTDVGIVLGDSAGGTGFVIKDSNGNEKIRFTSDGKIEFTEPILEEDPDSSTGEGTILAGETESLIENTLVELDSRIFISPTTSTFGQFPYSTDIVEAESFIVRIDVPVAEDIKFNYWIIN